MSRVSFQESIIVPSRMVFIMWLLFFIEFKFHYNLGFLGIYPRTINGLLGIVGMPLLHGSVMHISSNTAPILILGTTLYYFYPRIANKVFVQCYFFTNILVWIFARPAIHIGASGLIFGLATFLILYGLFKKDFRSVIISALVIAIYGGMFFQLIPVNPIVSWESHVMGAVVGGANAYLLSSTKKFSK